MNASELDAQQLMELQGLAAKAARKAGAGEDAADVAQETIAKLDDREFNDLGHVEAWVQRVAQNAAHDLRDRAKKIVGPYDDNLGLTPQSFTSDFVSKQKITDLVAGLPSKYQDVIELTYYEGLSASEVGERLGYATATVHKMLTEGRNMMRPNITAPPGYGESSGTSPTGDTLDQPLGAER